MENNVMRSRINAEIAVATVKQLPVHEQELIWRQAYGMAVMAKLLEGEKKGDDKSA